MTSVSDSLQTVKQNIYFADLYNVVIDPYKKLCPRQPPKAFYWGVSRAELLVV